MLDNESNLDEDGRLPLPISGIDLKALPIRPEEAFVLSRIDGELREADLAASTGLSFERVSKMLDRLAALGVIRFNGQSTNTEGSVRQTPEPHLDIPEQRQTRIVETYQVLETASHYELLGISADADKKAIKAAYYEMVNIFHPDRYFGKQLGSLKPKLERIFATLTEAHDTLTRQVRRDEYDRYLEAQQRTRRFDRLLSNSAQSAAVAKARQEIDAAARVDGASGLEAPRAPKFSAATMQAIESRTSPQFAHQPPSATSDQPIRIPLSEPFSRPVPNSESRRRALARKLRSLGPSTPAAQDSGPAPISQKELVSHAVDDLRRRYEERASKARNRHVGQLVEAAERALADNDVPAAMNSLKVAASLAPGDQQLAARLSEVQARVNHELSVGYLEQAKYEERDKKWRLAARSYARAARESREANLFERAAHCLLEHYLDSGGDLKSAREHAVTAVSIAPAVAQYRVTLAKILLHAGMQASAVAEFERAAQLSPNDANIRDWLRRAQNGTA